MKLYYTNSLTIDVYNDSFEKSFLYILYISLNVFIFMLCIYSIPYILKLISEHSGKTVTLLHVVLDFDQLYFALAIFGFMVTGGILIYAFFFEKYQDIYIRLYPTTVCIIIL